MSLLSLPIELYDAFLFRHLDWIIGALRLTCKHMKCITEDLNFMMRVFTKKHVLLSVAGGSFSSFSTDAYNDAATFQYVHNMYHLSMLSLPSFHVFNTRDEIFQYVHFDRMTTLMKLWNPSFLLMTNQSFNCKHVTYDFLTAFLTTDSVTSLALNDCKLEEDVPDRSLQTPLIAWNMLFSCFPNLKDLNLDNNSITDLGFLTFTHYCSEHGVETFSVRHNRVSCDGLASLLLLIEDQEEVPYFQSTFRVPFLSLLRELDLRENFIDSEGVVSHLEEVSVLKMRGLLPNLRLLCL